MRHSKAVLGAVVLSALGAPGCGKVMEFVRSLTGGGTDTAAPHATPAQGEAPQAPAEAPAGPTSSVRTPAPSQATGCPALQANAALLPGTVHNREVAADETLSLAGSPHRFPDGIDVHDRATLTVAPCAVVLIGHEQNAWVQGGGGLIAAGTETQPIRFGSDNTAPQPGDWHHLWLSEGIRSTSRLSYVVIEHAGMHRDNFDGALSVVARDLHLDHVTFRLNRGFGFGLVDGGTLRADSSDLTVEGTVAGDATHSGAIYVRRPSGVASLPMGRYQGNAVDEVFVAEGGTSDDMAIRRNATWRNLGVPYRLGDDVDVRVAGPGGPILTVEPGVMLRMGRNSGFSVGYDAEGGLVMDGQSEATRITLKPAGNDESPGLWHGIYFGPLANRSGSRVRFVNLRAAGATWSTSLCDWAGENGDGSFIYWQAQPGPSAIEHTSFAVGGPTIAAIGRGWEGPAVSFTGPSLGNDFSQFGGACHQSPVHVPGSGCPDPAPACD